MDVNHPKSGLPHLPHTPCRPCMKGLNLTTFRKPSKGLKVAFIIKLIGGGGSKKQTKVTRNKVFLSLPTFPSSRLLRPQLQPRRRRRGAPALDREVRPVRLPGRIAPVPPPQNAGGPLGQPAPSDPSAAVAGAHLRCPGRACPARSRTGPRDRPAPRNGNVAVDGGRSPATPQRWGRLRRCAARARPGARGHERVCGARPPKGRRWTLSLCCVVDAVGLQMRFRPRPPSPFP